MTGILYGEISHFSFNHSDTSSLYAAAVLMVGTVIGVRLFHWLFSLLKASALSPFFIFPWVTLLLAWVIKKETVRAEQLLGLLHLFAGLLLINLKTSVSANAIK